MSTVHKFPVSSTMTPEQALDSAKAVGYTEVLVVGYDDEGALVFRSSRMDRKDALWLAERMKAWALDGGDQ